MWADAKVHAWWQRRPVAASAKLPSLESGQCECRYDQVGVPKSLKASSRWHSSSGSGSGGAVWQQRQLPQLCA